MAIIKLVQFTARQSCEAPSCIEQSPKPQHVIEIAEAGSESSPSAALPLFSYAPITPIYSIPKKPMAMPAIITPTPYAEPTVLRERDIPALLNGSAVEVEVSVVVTSAPPVLLLPPVLVAVEDVVV